MRRPRPTTIHRRNGPTGGWLPVLAAVFCAASCAGPGVWATVQDPRALPPTDLADPLWRDCGHGDHADIGALQLRQGGLPPWDVVDIAPDGRYTLRSARPEPSAGRNDGPAAVVFRLTDEELGCLRRGLCNLDFFGLQDHYADERFLDGCVWSLSAEKGGRTKTVHGSNRFPYPLARWLKFARYELAGRHAEEFRRQVAPLRERGERTSP